jgi:tetraacyldisaccharide 4'-kinase
MSWHPHRALAPLGALYLKLSDTRLRWYESGRLTSQRVAVPVICVGNITAGGTGKSPAVQWLSRALTEAGFKVGIVSRGYGGQRAREPLVVAAPGQPNSDALAAGDEPAMLAQAKVAHCIVVGRDRVAAAQRAIELGCDLIVLDDGFQHRRLQRDLDIVLVDWSNPWGGGRGLPAGLLRESPAGIRRAQVVIVTRAATREIPPPIAAQIDGSRQLVTTARHQPESWINEHGEVRAAAGLAGRPVFAVTALAQSQALTDTLRQLNADVVGARSFVDHHRFRCSEIEQIWAEARERGAELLITTAKDAVRWPAGAHPASILTIRFEVDDEPAVLARARLASRR